MLTLAAVNAFAILLSMETGAIKEVPSPFGHNVEVDSEFTTRTCSYVRTYENEEGEIQHFAHDYKLVIRTGVVSGYDKDYAALKETGNVNLISSFCYRQAADEMDGYAVMGVRQ